VPFFLNYLLVLEFEKIKNYTHIFIKLNVLVQFSARYIAKKSVIRPKTKIIITILSEMGFTYETKNYTEMI
jgi:hypothetical protein